MKKSRFTDEQIVKILREADKDPVADVAKRHAVSEQTIAACTAVIDARKLDTKAIAVAHHNRGLALQLSGQTDRAIADYDEAIRLQPDYANAHIYRGSAYFEKFDFDRALQEFDQALRIEPNNALALYDRGNAWLAKGPRPPCNP